jgi:perosamine synthetase
MEKSNIEFSTFRKLGNEGRYLLDAFETGWVSGGYYVEALEEKLNTIFNGSKCFAVANGTLALQLSFQLMGLKPGDQVIVPGFCFQAAANVLIQLGAVPVFCDVHPLTWNQNLISMKRAVTERTVGVVIVHNYGRSAPSEDIAEWAKDNGFWIIEDCAEAWFTKHKNRYVGQFGNVSTFSMHATKTISSGEGGIVLLNDQSLIDKLNLLRSHGLDRSKAPYLHQVAGNNYRLSNLLCAIAYAQLEYYTDIIKHQEVRDKNYEDYLRGHWCIMHQQGLMDSRDNLWAFAVRINFSLLNISRSDLMQLLKERGIETRPGFYPASALLYNSEYITETLDVSEAIAKEIIVLPASLRLEGSHIKDVCEALIELLDVHRKPLTNYLFIDLKEHCSSQQVLTKFLANLGDGRNSFRYFDKRNPEVVHQHITSVVLQVEGEPVGYGHIETECDISWLGIAVAQGFKSRGWGKLIMRHLINSAIGNKIEELNLRVDAGNAVAIKMYKTYGFIESPELSNTSSLHMKLYLGNICLDPLSLPSPHIARD